MKIPLLHRSSSRKSDGSGGGGGRAEQEEPKRATFVNGPVKLRYAGNTLSEADISYLVGCEVGSLLASARRRSESGG